MEELRLVARLECADGDAVWKLRDGDLRPCEVHDHREVEAALDEAAFAKQRRRGGVGRPVRERELGSRLPRELRGTPFELCEQRSANTPPRRVGVDADETLDLGFLREPDASEAGNESVVGDRDDRVKARVGSGLGQMLGRLGDRARAPEIPLAAPGEQSGDCGRIVDRCRAHRGTHVGHLFRSAHLWTRQRETDSPLSRIAVTAASAS